MPAKTAFDIEFEKLNVALTEMGGVAEDQLAKALDALGRRDVALAQEVISGDKRLDAIEVKVEEMAIRILTLRQPMARDMRVVLSALKTSAALERIGDLAKNTARRAVTLAAHDPQPIAPAVQRLGKQTLALLSDVLGAYAARDVARAKAVWARDVEVDELYSSLSRAMLADLSRDSGAAPQVAQFMFVAKNLERIGDHATFIAEMVYFINTGEPLREDRPKGEADGFDLAPGAE